MLQSLGRGIGRACGGLASSASVQPKSFAPLAAPLASSQRSLHTSQARHEYMYKYPGFPMFYLITHDRPFYHNRILEYEVMPRDEFGVPAHIPPDLSTVIQHTYYIPPAYYPFLKKLGDDDPKLKPFMDKLIKGELTFAGYEEMFYKSAKPTRIYRNKIPMPYRTEEEESKEAECRWQEAWYMYKQRVWGEYMTRYMFRKYWMAVMFGIYCTQLWMVQVIYYQEDMKLFYIEAPEHKINWVVPRGDL